MHSCPAPFLHPVPPYFETAGGQRLACTVTSWLPDTTCAYSIHAYIHCTPCCIHALYARRARATLSTTLPAAYLASVIIDIRYNHDNNNNIGGGGAIGSKLPRDQPNSKNQLYIPSADECQTISTTPLNPAATRKPQQTEQTQLKHTRKTVSQTAVSQVSVDLTVVNPLSQHLAFSRGFNLFPFPNGQPATGTAGEVKKTQSTIRNDQTVCRVSCAWHSKPLPMYCCDLDPSRPDAESHHVSCYLCKCEDWLIFWSYMPWMLS